MPAEPSSIVEGFRARLQAAIPMGSAICAGFSGGLDSSVLLHLLSEHGPAMGYRITALHVHHGLSPNADDWVRSCERFCANQGVPLSVEHVRVDRTGNGVEAAARVARYAAYAARPENVIALAHHLDDQAETVMLQLLRGTGLKGIAAMPELRPLLGTRLQVWRPLLEHTRAELLAYADEHGLRWIEDESNASRDHDRNFFRHDVGPLFDARFPAWRESLARFARHAGAASGLLDALAGVDGVSARAGEPLVLGGEISGERRANALRAFLARNAVTMPTEVRLAEMTRQLFEAREDARVRIDHAGVSLVRQRGAVHIERGLDAIEPWRVEWRHEPSLELGQGRGRVHFEPAQGQGISAERAGQEGWYFAPRGGGEALRLGTERPTRTLKNLLQEHDIPAWQRDRLPLLFHGDRLVWVPGVGIAAEYACGPGQPGFQPSWTVAVETPL